jgi:hypothetical protein
MKYHFLLCLTIFTLFLNGCSPAVAPRIGAQTVASANRIIYLRRDGQYATLSRYLKVVNEVQRRDQNGLFNVILVFNNDRYYGYFSNDSPNLVIDIQFVFYDRDGIEVDKTNWQPNTFQAGVDVTVKQVSINPDTVSYKAYVREPRTPSWD